MRIDLDEHYCIVLNQWGNPVLVKQILENGLVGEEE